MSKTRFQSRRRFSYNYEDVGELRGVSAQACRKWFARRGWCLQRDSFVQNLQRVVEYAKAQ
jgi:uncharacterized protein YjcR